MQVGIDARLVYYTRAGIGEYTLRLTQALAALFPADQFTLLQDCRSRQPLITAPNVAPPILASQPSPAGANLLPLVVSGVHADVFHSPDFIPPLHAHGRSVITIHDLAFLIYPHFLTKEARATTARSTAQCATPTRSSPCRKARSTTWSACWARREERSP